MSEPFLGQIILFGGNFAPRGWAFCQGQLLAISSNSALYSILGTSYGGDGRTNFALPDLRGRAPVGQGTGPGLSTLPLGASGGQEQVTLTANNMPPHAHGLIASSETPNTQEPGAAYLPTGVSRVYASAPGTPVRMADGVGTAGGGQPFDARSPYLALNYIIALQGLFPSRS